MLYWASIICLLSAIHNPDKSILFWISIVLSGAALFLAVLEELMTDKFLLELLRKQEGEK